MTENWPKCPNDPTHVMRRTQLQHGTWSWRCNRCDQVWSHLGGLPAAPPAPPAPRWIPVTERVPNHGKPVPVAGVSGRHFLIWSPAEMAWRTTDRTQRHCPTHWYDLPEPPAPEPMKLQVRWVRTGEFRAPRKGEWYESSDARPLQAEEDWTGSRWILRRVEVPS